MKLNHKYANSGIGAKLSNDLYYGVNYWPHFLFLPLLLHWKTLCRPQLFQAVLLVLLFLSLKQGKAFLLALQLPAPASGLLHRPLGLVGG